MHRVSQFAGSFYPAQPAELLHTVKYYLSQAQEVTSPVADPLCMLLMPHAGYVYCGPVMGAGLVGAGYGGTHPLLPNTLVLLGPNHTGRGTPLSVWDKGSWQTPLGDVPVNEELAAGIVDQNLFRSDIAAHTGEHSLEVLLPFLQVYFASFRQSFSIVPIAVGRADISLAAAKLAPMLRCHGAGIIVSSDMDHYNDVNTCMTRTALVAEQFMALDPVGMYQTVQQNNISMCGIIPATLGLMAAKVTWPNILPHVFAQSHSGIANEEADSVVGYASFGLSWTGQTDAC